MRQTAQSTILGHTTICTTQPLTPSALSDNLPLAASHMTGVYFVTCCYTAFKGIYRNKVNMIIPNKPKDFHVFSMKICQSSSSFV